MSEKDAQASQIQAKNNREKSNLFIKIDLREEVSKKKRMKN